MMSRFRKRHWPLSLLVIAVLAALLSVAPPAHATNGGDAQYFELPYDCLQGQTVTFVPGQVRVQRLAEDGLTVTYATIISDRIDVWPHEWGNEEDARGQLELQPGTQSNFHPEADLPLNPTKVVRFTYQLEWEGSSGSAEYLPSEFQCTGTPTDGDGDGVPDELDGCPAQAAPESPDGCPSGVTVAVTGTTPGDLETGALGSATVNVTNVVDGAGTENYLVWLESQSQTVLLPDGAYSSLTFTGLPGDWSICAQSDTRAAKSCVMATIPSEDSTPEPVYAGSVSYTQTCTGLRYTITNAGSEPLNVSVRLTHYGNSLGTTSVWSLASGASRTLVTPRYFRAAVYPTLYSPEAGLWSQVLPAKQWVVSSSCSVWMLGGTKFVKWGPQLTVSNGYPLAVVSTKAYRAWVGYQVKGSSEVHWVARYGPGRHVLRNFLKVARHKQKTIRLWVVYTDATNYVRYGKTAITRYHTFRRP